MFTVFMWMCTAAILCISVSDVSIFNFLLTQYLHVLTQFIYMYMKFLLHFPMELQVGKSFLKFVISLHVNILYCELQFQIFQFSSFGFPNTCMFRRVVYIYIYMLTHNSGANPDIFKRRVPTPEKGVGVQPYIY